MGKGIKTVDVNTQYILGYDAAMGEMESTMSAITDERIERLEEYAQALEHRLRLCGMAVMGFVTPSEKVKEYRGNDDVYHPDHVLDLIRDLLVLSFEAVNKLKYENAALKETLKGLVS